jgi:glyoxylase-like metal-dependent hydrolase (beta-lactamase superfamily II)
MARTAIHTIDLNFQGSPLGIAAYMLEHSGGVVLVESGPGSTIEALTAALQTRGYGIRDVTHVLLTHIHLDHAGAAGYLARQGAQIFVHPRATLVYGDEMESLWGEMLPVPPEKLTVLQDNDEVTVGDLRFVALATPGHAEHHIVYQFEDLAFTGDVGAVRIPGYSYLRIPTTPPEFHLEKWRESVARLQKAGFKRIAPTHFGIFHDADWHLSAILKSLDNLETWMTANLPGDPPVEELKRRFAQAMTAEGRAEGVSDEMLETYQLANLLSMSVDGMARYWKKYRGENGNA